MHWYDILFYLTLLGLLAWFAPRAVLWTLLALGTVTLVAMGLATHPGVVIGMVLASALYAGLMHLMD